MDAGPAAARLPERCVRYKTTVAALGTCAALSRDDRDSMMRTYLHMENLWATAASNSLVGLGPGCEMARRDLVSLEARCGRAPGAAERDLPLD